MLEQLNKKREEYLAKLEEIQAMDLDNVVENEISKVREQIKEEVLAKYNEELKAADLKIVVIDELIADEEAKQELEAAAEEVAEEVEQPENQIEE